MTTVYIYIYIYIYRERERERERKTIPASIRESWYAGSYVQQLFDSEIKQTTLLALIYCSKVKLTKKTPTTN
jgi:hypothetical protein